MALRAATLALLAFPVLTLASPHRKLISPLNPTRRSSALEKSRLVRAPAPLRPLLQVSVRALCRTRSSSTMAPPCKPSTTGHAAGPRSRLSLKATKQALCLAHPRVSPPPSPSLVRVVPLRSPLPTLGSRSLGHRPLRSLPALPPLVDGLSSSCTKALVFLSRPE